MNHPAAVAALAWLALTPSLVVAQRADSAYHALRDLIEGLAPSARVRIGSGGERWTGRVSTRSSDSVVVLGETGVRSFRIPAIDSLWLRRENHDAAMAGAGLGAVIFTLFLIAGPPEERYMNLREGAIFLVGATSAGLLIDAMTDRWSQWYPE